MNAIDLSQLNVNFNGKQVLKNISLSVKDGDKLHIYGSNGAGKSTLLRCLVALLTPTSGEIRIYSKKPEFALNKVGYLSANAESLFSRLSGEENIRLMSELIGQTSEQHPFKRTFESDELFKQLLNTPFHQCSSGMKRYLLFYLSLMQNPDLLIMDEPFMGMAPALKEKLINFMQDQLSSKTILVVSHDHQLAPSFFHNKIELKDGGLC